jgi:integrase
MRVSMAVRKRTWKTSSGENREAWIVDYTDQSGERHIRTFPKKKEADDFHATVRVEVRSGTHTAESKSITVARAGDLWIASAEAVGLERTTIDSYRQQLRLHTVPYLGSVKLSALTAPMVRDFEDKLRAGTFPPGSTQKCEPRSAAMVKKVRGALGSILADAQERGLVARNVVRDLRAKRRGVRNGAPSAGNAASSRSASISPHRKRFGRSCPTCPTDTGGCC